MWLLKRKLANTCQAFEGQHCSQQLCSGIPLAKHEQTSEIPNPRLVSFSEMDSAALHCAANPPFKGCMVLAGVLQDWGCLLWTQSVSCCPACPGSGSQVSSSSLLAWPEEKGRIKCRESSASLMRHEGGACSLSLDAAASFLSLHYRIRSAGAILGSALSGISFHLY